MSQDPLRIKKIHFCIRPVKIANLNFRSSRWNCGTTQHSVAGCLASSKRWYWTSTALLSEGRSSINDHPLHSATSRVYLTIVSTIPEIPSTNNSLSREWIWNVKSWPEENMRNSAHSFVVVNGYTSNDSDLSKDLLIFHAFHVPLSLLSNRMNTC